MITAVELQIQYRNNFIGQFENYRIILRNFRIYSSDTKVQHIIRIVGVLLQRLLLLQLDKLFSILSGINN